MRGLDIKSAYGASHTGGSFHQITQSILVVRMIKMKGYYSTLCYLYDFLCIETSEQRCQEAMDTLQELLASLHHQCQQANITHTAYCVPCDVYR